MMRILVVDKDRGELASLADILRAAGFDVVLAGAADTGLILLSGDVTAAGAVHPQAVRALRSIEERFPETDLTVRSIARDLGVSTEHLCRLLKRDTGCTFGALLRSARVRAARALLESTNLCMKEIAARAGFVSASRFDRDFRKVCGLSPSQYRIVAVRQRQH
jgi:transcriptional regulator GlxA family with amidase domain